MQLGETYIGKVFNYIVISVVGRNIHVVRFKKSGEHFGSVVLDSSFFWMYCEKQGGYRVEEEILELNYRKPHIKARSASCLAAMDLEAFGLEWYATWNSPK